ncbi:MAG: GAF domain-containing sensor histidine kinase [bacterium]
MPLPSLPRLIKAQRHKIFRETVRRIADHPWSPYQEFLVRTAEGQDRLQTWLDLFAEALAGHEEAFLEDQKSIGYVRSRMEGFGLEVLTQFYCTVPDVMWRIIDEAVGRRGSALPALPRQIQHLNTVLLRGYSAIATSYVKSREEGIVEKVKQLQDLNRFTREIITLIEPEELVRFLLGRMATLFGVEETAMALCREGKVQGVYRHPPAARELAPNQIMEKTLKRGTIWFLDASGRPFRFLRQSPRKRAVSVPVRAHGRLYGVLCLRNRCRSFVFLEKELGLLNQFLHIMAVALENAFMLKENREAREQLHLLTGRMITIQEEERRRVAGDIHDTLTQALIGIGYKMQFCREIAGRKHELLLDQLEILLRTVNQAIDQSRALISSLRPDLIDTMGLVPALKRHFQSFSEETGIRVKARLPRKTQLPVGVNICLFRIAQEALMNVYKHAETREVEVALGKRNGRMVFVVADKGRGFDPAKTTAPGRSDLSRLGLLSMRERIESEGGSLQIRAAERRGCRIEAMIPIPLDDRGCRKTPS